VYVRAEYSARPCALREAMARATAAA